MGPHDVLDRAFEKARDQPAVGLATRTGGQRQRTPVKTTHEGWNDDGSRLRGHQLDQRLPRETPFGQMTFAWLSALDGVLTQLGTQTRQSAVGRP